MKMNKRKIQEKNTELRRTIEKKIHENYLKQAPDGSIVSGVLMPGPSGEWKQ